MSKAYVKEITDNTVDVNGEKLALGNTQQSPSWVLTFVRWDNRFPYQYNNPDPMSVRKPFIVQSDCVTVSVQQAKGQHTPSASAMLLAGDISYDTALAPGDFMFVNILKWESKAREVADRAAKSENINKEDDGFKGVYRIQSVRRVLGVDPSTGTKRLMFQIQAFAFTEFNNTIYFNPFLLTEAERSNDFLFISRLSDTWQQQVGKENINNVQQILALLINSLVGTGVSEEGKNVKGSTRSVNVQFFIPKLVGQLLGVKGATSAKDIYNYLFGIQQYASSPNQSLAAGVNPKINRIDGRYIFCPTPCTGNVYVKAEYWNQVTLWSILNQYSNSPINELYTCFRMSPSGKVMPTVVFRQIPFSSEVYKGQSTKFLNLPRWKISVDLLTDVNLGREEAARINFVQVFGRVNQLSGEAQNAEISQQIAKKNYRYDIKDIQRNGLRPYITSSNFDAIASDNKSESYAIRWTELLADSLIGGHLKTNGTIECIGIEEPIAVGDNLELDGIVYHIESVNHTASNAPNGTKVFRTSIQISHGVDLRSDKNAQRFPSMDEVDRDKESISDFERDRMLPGFTDEQAIPSREKNAAYGKNDTKSESFFHPPNTKKKDKPKQTKPKRKK